MSESWRIVQGGGPSAGFEDLAILVLGASEGSMLGREEERPAKSHSFDVEDMVVLFCWCVCLHGRFVVSGILSVLQKCTGVQRHRRRINAYASAKR